MTRNDLEHKSIAHKIKRDGAGICYFYPSDLAELKLVPYPGHWEVFAERQTLQQEPEQEESLQCQVARLEPANIRLRLENQEWYQFIPCRYDEKKGIVYISEEDFNQYWKEIRYKLMGHYIAKKHMRTITKEELDRQVCLEAYLTQTQEARIIDAKIVLFARLPEAERLRLMSKRASMMDNRKILYIFDRNGGPVHDKTCELVKGIPLEDFRGAEEMPEGRGFCAKCRRRLHVRLACGPDFKNYPVYESFLQRCGVSELELEYFIREYGGKMYMESLHVMRLRCGEDTWKVERKEGGLLVLYHNNYIRIGEEERFITDGFHEQNVFARRMNRILRYVEDYTWKGHLEAKRGAEDSDVTGAMVVREDGYEYGWIGDSMTESGASEGQELDCCRQKRDEDTTVLINKEAWWKRLAAWLKKWSYKFWQGKK